MGVTPLMKPLLLAMMDAFEFELLAYIKASIMPNSYGLFNGCYSHYRSLNLFSQHL